MSMRLQAGEKAPRVNLPAIDSSSFDTNSLAGKPYMLSFYRFAGCPFCNLRLHERIKQVPEFGPELGGSFSMVAIFDSPLDNLIQHAKTHNAPFPILADEKNQAYKEYGIEHSVFGVVKGIVTRMPTLRRAIAMGFSASTIKGSITTMPADFCIDEAGIIQIAY